MNCPDPEQIILQKDSEIFNLTQENKRLLDKMYLNMQYYYEYCLSNGYVTPKEWIEKYKHF
jgi:hypothetical protein